MRAVIAFVWDPAIPKPCDISDKDYQASQPMPLYVTQQKTISYIQ